MKHVTMRTAVVIALTLMGTNASAQSPTPPRDEFGRITPIRDEFGRLDILEVKVDKAVMTASVDSYAALLKLRYRNDLDLSAKEAKRINAVLLPKGTRVALVWAPGLFKSQGETAGIAMVQVIGKTAKDRKIGYVNEKDFETIVQPPPKRKRQ